MNINFNEVDKMSTNSFVNVTEGTTSYRASTSTGSIDGSGFKLDISSVVTDNNAYKGHGKTVEEVAINAGAMDVSAYRDYMAVMSNCLSSEDFDKLQKEGFNPGETDFKDVVSIVDHIKAALVQGGVNVAGYTDTISEDALVSILGSEVYAKEVASECMANDIPLNAENAKEIADNYEKLSSVGPLGEGNTKFLVENNLVPNVDNIYTSTHAGAYDATKQARGYYNAGDISGYYAKKPDMVDINALRPQIEKVISESSFEINEEHINDATWLIEKGIPLTEDTFTRYENIKNIELPMSFNEFAKKACEAISDGIAVGKVDLSRNSSLRAEALNIYNEVQNSGTIKGRRVLEEVRLSMSVEANLKLLRSGFAIDTAPMEELIKELKAAEEDIAKSLMNENDGAKAVEKKQLFDGAIDVLANIKAAPITIVNQIELSDELQAVSNKATNLRSTYEKANNSYEQLMTSPRQDMGDSIRKAFNNVDDILSEIGEEITPENRRAVRILGYNSTEITAENIASIKEKDKLLVDTINGLTPGRVLNMIRGGINPITMSIEELNEYLNNQDMTKEDMMSYSKFLYKLEKDKSISEDEKDAYIGIYRLLRQIEKSDFASIGALEETGAVYSLENMLSAIRSKKHNMMDYKIDDSFGGIDVKETGVDSITAQINRIFPDGTSDLNEMFSNSENMDANQEYMNEQADEIREAFKSENEVIEALISYDEAVSSNNIADMNIMLKTPAVVFKRLRELGYKKELKINIDSKKDANESFKEMTGSIKEFLENEIFGISENGIRISSNNVKQVGKMYQHFDFLNRQSEEENYSIPAQIDGELTAINLKVIHDKNNMHKVAISFESDFYGKVAAEFKDSANGFSGFCSITNAEKIKNLENNKKALYEKLNESDINISNIYFAGTDRLDLVDFNLKEIKDRVKDTDVITTNGLYTVAKAFIEYVVENADAS